MTARHPTYRFHPSAKAPSVRGERAKLVSVSHTNVWPLGVAAQWLRKNLNRGESMSWDEDFWDREVARRREELLWNIGELEAIELCELRKNLAEFPPEKREERLLNALAEARALADALLVADVLIGADIKLPLNN